LCDKTILLGWVSGGELAAVGGRAAETGARAPCSLPGAYFGQAMLDDGPFSALAPKEIEAIADWLQC